jgi:glycosyltransferase involved in cell wall biosynthesis
VIVGPHATDSPYEVAFALVCAGLPISVVVCTWNGGERIVTTLDSLVRQTIGTNQFEVVVVDDGSTDNTANEVRGFAGQHRVLRLSYVRIEHAGVNAARNAGIQASIGQVVAFLDDDEIAPTDHLERILALMSDPATPRAGVGGPARPTNPEEFRTCGRCVIGEAVLPVHGSGSTHRLLGGNMALRRSLFTTVGPFDPAISGRGDETEWFARASRDFWYDDSLIVWHRRDHLSARQLLMTGFRQGRAVPLARSRTGDEVYRPSPSRLCRYLGHAFRFRCMNGVLQASREFGAMVGGTPTGSTRRGSASSIAARWLRSASS